MCSSRSFLPSLSLNASRQLSPLRHILSSRPDHVTRQMPLPLVIGFCWFPHTLTAPFGRARRRPAPGPTPGSCKPFASCAL